jgi:hypothetical protein
MTTEFGKRRAEIVSFLKGLSERERLIVLEYLSKDAVIRARVPELARAVFDLRRSCHTLKTLRLVQPEHATLDLELLARRKGCRLERAEGPADRLRIVGPYDRDATPGIDRHATSRRSLSRAQALEILRALPDRDSSIKP